jgi:hypothetical protein
LLGEEEEVVDDHLYFLHHLLLYSQLIEDVADLIVSVVVSLYLNQLLLN